MRYAPLNHDDSREYIKGWVVSCPARGTEIFTDSDKADAYLLIAQEKSKYPNHVIKRDAFVYNEEGRKTWIPRN